MQSQMPAACCRTSSNRLQKELHWQLIRQQCLQAQLQVLQLMMAAAMWLRCCLQHWMKRCWVIPTPQWMI
jgi:hypothetical protein